MRYLLMFSAFILAATVALRFAGEPSSKPAFEGRRVILITEGRQSDNFVNAVLDGARKAMKDLGCEVYAYPSNGNAAEEVNIFQREMARAPDGICIIGNPTNADLTTHIEDALDADITVTTYYHPLPDMQQSHRLQGFGFVGPDFNRAGYALIEAAVVKHMLPPGGRVLLILDEARGETDELLSGCLAAIAKHGLLEDRLVVNAQRSGTAGNELLARLSAAPLAPPALVCLLDGTLSDTGSWIRQAGFEPGELPLVGVGIADTTSGQYPDVESSYVSILLSEEIATQAYLAVLQICMTKSYGAVGTNVVTPYKLFGAADPSDLAQTDASRPFVQIY